MSIQTVEPREPEKLHVFVSHVWARDASYVRLVQILERLLGQRLVNHSVPTAEALHLLSAGPEAASQERSLQAQHLSYCREQIRIRTEQNSRLQVDLSNRRQQFSRIQSGLRAVDEIPKVEAKIRNGPQIGLGERLTRLEVAYLEDLRQRAATTAGSEHAESLRNSIRKLEAELNEANADLRARSVEVTERLERISLLDGIESGEMFNMFHHPDVLFRAMSDSQSVQRLHPNLALELYYRIRVADVVVVLASANDLYREWMVFENNLITDLRKPLIVVQPDEATPVPPELVSFSMASPCKLSSYEVGQRLGYLLGARADALLAQNRHDHQ
jgi:hypothetical protein